MKHSKGKIVQRVRFFIKTANKKLIKAEAYTAPLLLLPLQNQPLQIARKQFEHMNLNFADKGKLDGKIDLLIVFDSFLEFSGQD